MDYTIIDRILNETQGPCLSILVPTNRLSRDRMQNVEVLRKSVQQGKELLYNRMGPSPVFDDYVNRLDELARQFDPVHAKEGLGLFISPALSEKVIFPFHVTEKVIVDDTFETRDLIYLNQFLSPYLALVLTKKSARLFSMRGDQYEEIKDGHFPMEHEEEYEYSRSNLGTSFGFATKGFEKDKSIVEKVRVQAFYHEVIPYLSPYLTSKDIPFLVAGSKNQLAEFMTQPGLSFRIDEKIIGTFDDHNLGDFCSRAWMGINHFRQKETLELISSFRESDRPGHLAKGLQEVWQAAREGRGKLLMVEKDYHCLSYSKDNDPVLYLEPPDALHALVPDAVDHIIGTTLDKGGKVWFTDSGQLNEFGHIALMLRY